MNIDEMTMDQIEERLSQIDALAQEDGADIEALNAEVTALKERRESIKKEAAERRATLERVAEGPITRPVKEDRIMPEERIITPETTEYRDAYMKQLMGRAITEEERTALATSANVMPKQTLDKIYGKLEENPLIKELDALHIPGALSVPKATTVNDASWVSVGTASTDSADVIGSVSLSQKMLIKTVEIKADLSKMSIPSFENWLVNKLVQKMEAAICAAVVCGAGSTDAYGIATRVTLGSAISSVTLAKLGKFMAGVRTAYHKNAVWIMSADTFYGKILGLATDSNGMLVADGLGYRLLGRKVILDENVIGKFGSEAASSDHIIFGSIKDGYVFNFGDDIEVEADKSVGFRAGSTVYRSMALADGDVADTEAFAIAAIS